MESFPPDTWTESGQTPVLTESSSSRVSSHSLNAWKLVRLRELTPKRRRHR